MFKYRTHWFLSIIMVIWSMGVFACDEVCQASQFKEYLRGLSGGCAVDVREFLGSIKFGEDSSRESKLAFDKGVEGSGKVGVCNVVDKHVRSVTEFFKLAFFGVDFENVEGLLYTIKACKANQQKVHLGMVEGLKRDILTGGTSPLIPELLRISAMDIKKWQGVGQRDAKAVMHKNLCYDYPKIIELTYLSVKTIHQYFESDRVYRLNAKLITGIYDAVSQELK